MLLPVFIMKHVTALFSKTKTRSVRAGNKQEEEEFGRTTDRPNILTLPVELALEIADHLSAVDIACLALCTRGLLATLGGSTLAGKSWNKHELALFLTTLSRDLADHFFCRNCCRLHSSSLVGPPGPDFQPSKRLHCLDKEEQIGINKDLHTRYPFERCYRLSFTHVLLALKRQWYGLNHGISTESLAFTGVYRLGFEKGDGK